MPYEQYVFNQRVKPLFDELARLSRNEGLNFVVAVQVGEAQPVVAARVVREDANPKLHMLGICLDHELDQVRDMIDLFLSEEKGDEADV